MDSLVNFGKAVLSTGYDDVVTSIVLSPTDFARLPQTAPYNLVWWNHTDFPSPEDDSAVEIVRVTTLDAGTYTLTIARAQEGTAAVTHNTEAKEYWLMNGLTKAVMDGIQSSIDGKAPTSHTHLLAAGATDVTATAAELNVLDGIVPTVTELNYMDAVTSNVQTQLNAKVTNATHTGDVTGATVLTITAGAVDLAMMAGMATGSLIYRKTALAGVPEVQTLATLKTDLGSMPASDVYAWAKAVSAPAGSTLVGLGVTATAAELNKLDGVLTTAAELNFVDGVTSAIQTQFNGKAATSHTHTKSQITDFPASMPASDVYAWAKAASAPAAVTLVGLGVTAIAAELNKLDGVLTTAAELNFVDGVTSAIQTQLGTKLPIAGGTMTGVLYSQVNTSYTTRQVRNVIESTANASGGSTGDIWIKYTA